MIDITLFRDYPHSSDAHQYILDVISKKIPANIDVQNACRRQIKDLLDLDLSYEYNPTLADRAVSFIETLPHTKGKKFVGKNLTLEPWQKFIICILFGWVDSSDNRRFNEAYISVGRKNGKSALASAICHLVFCLDEEPGVEVYCGATNQKQSWEVFKPARLMALKRPQLCERFGIEVNASNLAIPADGGKFEPVVGNPGDGSSPCLWVVDEYHEHPTNDQVDTAQTGMGSRDQPLLLMITTAGVDTSSPCYDKYSECQRILNGTEKDISTEKIFCIMYGLDLTDNWSDPANLRKANPNIGVSVSQLYLETTLAAAIRKPSKQNIFKIKHLNQWVNAKESWLSAKSWADCGDDALKEEDCLHLQCILALDLASKLDICSFVRVYYEDKSSGRHYYVFGHHFLPLDRVEEEDNFSYKGWVEEGWLTPCGQSETDLDEVEDQVLAFLDVCDVREVTYDQWKATHLAQRLEKEGSVKIVEFKQNAMAMSPAMDELEAAIVSGRLHHDNCPVMKWMAGNVIAKPYKTDFKTPTKNKPHNKIDGIVALIMGIGRAMYSHEQSIYDRD